MSKEKLMILIKIIIAKKFQIKQVKLAEVQEEKKESSSSSESSDDNVSLPKFKPVTGMNRPKEISIIDANSKSEVLQFKDEVKEEKGGE